MTNLSLQTPSLPVASTTPGSAVSKQQSEIRKAASEFESVLLGQWLNSAESSFATVPGSDDDADPGDEQMKSFAVAQLGQALTAAGGIGIAKMVGGALEHSANEESMRVSVTKAR